ncbi:MAG: formylglycine-generating enzyme family protein, partial [Myxococcota bacterium]|nr:formylglycine-generating enzyme family protein [Myxococcota bacterium]
LLGWLLDHFPEHSVFIRHFIHLSLYEGVRNSVRGGERFRQGRLQQALLTFYQPTIINFCFDVWATFFGMPPLEKLSVGLQRTTNVKYRAKVSGSIRLLEYELVYVESGSFYMGARDFDQKAQKRERPLHTVIISESMYMGSFLVTQALYQDVMGNNPSHFRGSNFPVENITWYDCIRFCNALSDRENLNRVYHKKKDGEIEVRWMENGYRLPTEAEWEYCARAGEETLYAGSNHIDDVAWHVGNSKKRSQPVGMKKANAFGLYDMSGLVWEWCWDWGLRAYAGTQFDPYGLSAGAGRILRGGSLINTAHNARVSNRDLFHPMGHSAYGGFRVLRKPF